MKAIESYQDKVNAFKADALYQALNDADRVFLDKLFAEFKFTQQELRILTEAACDLRMWQEMPLKELWQEGLSAIVKEGASQSDAHRIKKEILTFVRDRVSRLKKIERRYPEEKPDIQKPQRELYESATDKPLLGPCPVASPKTVCCQLRTLDAVESCDFGCSYCTIQTFYGDKIVFNKNLKEQLERIKLEPDRFYHIGTGQSSDALRWGNRNGILDHLSAFAARHPAILLELKTKSDNIEYFFEHQVASNIVCSWSLNTETIINHEEHFTASLDRRLKAARQVADTGVKVAFHFHPIVYYENWQAEYRKVVEEVLTLFRAEEVAFISYGSVTLIKPVIKEIRKRKLPTKILQMEMVKDPHGKLTYPDDIKLSLFSAINEYFKPWHGKVYRYLCMERSFFWDKLFGWHYETNDEFEKDFGRQVMLKL